MFGHDVCAGGVDFRLTLTRQLTRALRTRSRGRPPQREEADELWERDLSSVLTEIAHRTQDVN